MAGFSVTAEENRSLGLTLTMACPSVSGTRDGKRADRRIESDQKTHIATNQRLTHSRLLAEFQVDTSVYSQASQARIARKPMHQLKPDADRQYAVGSNKAVACCVEIVPR